MIEIVDSAMVLHPSMLLCLPPKNILILDSKTSKKMTFLVLPTMVLSETDMSIFILLNQQVKFFSVFE